MLTAINSHYGQFPLLAYVPIVGFFLERSRLKEINKHMWAKLGNDTVDRRERNDLVLVDLKLRAEIFEKGQRRSFLTIALCVGCIAANFYAPLFMVIAGITLLSAWTTKKIISHNAKLIFEFETTSPNYTYRELQRKMNGISNIQLSPENQQLRNSIFARSHFLSSLANR